MGDIDRTSHLTQHLARFFSGHASALYAWPHGPAVVELPNLRVLCFEPGPKTKFRVYASVGASESHKDVPIEFLIIAPDRDARHVELLTMAAWYHKTEKLGLGHTFPIGEPWLPGSKCSHMLVSLPYTYGPSLEICECSSGEIHFLWLIPITETEWTFKVREGQEALEKRFDGCCFEYWNPDRPSVV